MLPELKTATFNPTVFSVHPWYTTFVLKSQADFLTKKWDQERTFPAPEIKSAAVYFTLLQRSLNNRL